MKARIALLIGIFSTLLLGALAGQAPHAAAAAAPSASASYPPIGNYVVLFAKIRSVFRSHRPPPPYETYELFRKQMTDYGYPDYDNTYQVDYWCRTVDRACLKRKLYHLGAIGRMRYERAAFNEDYDPGPPTADIFQRAPATPRPKAFKPTPEPAFTPLPTIIVVKALYDPDYEIVDVTRDGGLLDVRVKPRRTPMRNRLRELWVDARTLEIEKFTATDRLFVTGGGSTTIYPVLFTCTMGRVDGYPVITHIDGRVGGGYEDDGKHVTYDFKKIRFPKTLPAWYFNARDYGSHLDEAPLTGDQR